MLKNFKKVFFILVLLFSLGLIVGCSDVVEEDPNSGIIGGNGGTTINGNKKREYTVTLTQLGDIYYPDTDIKVYWRSTLDTKEAIVDRTTGTATVTDLDGEYHVSIDNDSLPRNLSYDPNIYFTNADNPHVEIELYTVYTPVTKNNCGGIDWWLIKDVGAYRTLITYDNAFGRPNPVYYEFTPTKSGYYSIESTVSTVTDNINPRYTTYYGVSTAKFMGKTYNGDEIGEPECKPGPQGTYTYNFKIEISCNSAELHAEASMGVASWSFAISATSKSAAYPIVVDWRIVRLDEKGDNHYIPTERQEVKTTQLPTEVPPTSAESGLTLYNSNNGIGNYPGAANGDKLITSRGGERIWRNPVDGSYWVCEKDSSGTYQPVSRLCFYITQPYPYTDLPFTSPEVFDNNFILNNGKSIYVDMIKVQYPKMANADGVCYVTDEIRQFLQYYAVKHYIFNDGRGGICDEKGIHAAEEDMWLFACCYYSDHKIPN